MAKLGVTRRMLSSFIQNRDLGGIPTDVLKGMATRERLLEALRKGLKGKERERYVGVSHCRLHDILRSMIKRGEIKRVGWGKYQIVSKSPRLIVEYPKLRKIRQRASSAVEAGS